MSVLYPELTTMQLRTWDEEFHMWKGRKRRRHE